MWWEVRRIVHTSSGRPKHNAVAEQEGSIDLRSTVEVVRVGSELECIQSQLKEPSHIPPPGKFSLAEDQVRI